MNSIKEITIAGPLILQAQSCIEDSQDTRDTVTHKSAFYGFYNDILIPDTFWRPELSSPPHPHCWKHWLSRRRKQFFCTNLISCSFLLHLNLQFQWRKENCNLIHEIWMTFSLPCRLDVTNTIRRNHFEQSAHGTYILPRAIACENWSEKWENIAEPEWILVSLNENREKNVVTYYKHSRKINTREWKRWCQDKNKWQQEGHQYV